MPIWPINYPVWHSSNHHRPRREPCPIHERVIYPVVEVAATYNPCLEETNESEHILECNHVIVTKINNEPCAQNCHHVNFHFPDKSKVPSIVNGKAFSLEFYCDACVGTEIETRVPKRATATEAWEFRKNERERLDKRNGKSTRFRECDPSAMTTEVPCDRKGSPLAGYVPRKDHHPRDDMVPQIGYDWCDRFNEFDEDVVHLTEEDEHAKREGEGEEELD